MIEKAKEARARNAMQSASRVRFWAGKLSRPLSLFLTLFLSTATLCSETNDPGFYRPLDRASLIGTWEGLLPLEQHLVRIEIKESGESYAGIVVMADSVPVAMYAMKSVSVDKGWMELYFMADDRSDGFLKISGKGYATDVIGGDYIDATFVRGRATQGYTGKPLNVILRRGPWTRKIGRFSEAAEEAINKLRESHALENGKIYNIPVYDQAIIQGEWSDRPPSAEESRNALKTIELFFANASVTTNSDREAIDCIRDSKVTYRVQFIGIERHARNIILCNFFVDRQSAKTELRFPKWQIEKVSHPPEGCDFWHIEYDPETDKVANVTMG